MGKHRTLIFDFDGTLADTFEIAVNTFRKFAKRWHRTDDEEIERLRGMSAREVLKTLGIRWWELPYMTFRVRRTVHRQMVDAKTFKGLEPVLRKLHADGHHLIVVSSNGTNTIVDFLRRVKLEQYFEKVYGGRGLFSKAGTITEIALTRKLNPKDCWYIGDEVRDVEAARKAGVHSVAVSWGYNNRQALEKANAETLIDTPKELAALFVPKKVT